MYCSHDPKELRGAPIGMYHCPVCGEMVLAGVEHPNYSLLKRDDDYKVVWYCFDCGATDDGTGERKFKTEHYHAGDCDVTCLACGSAHTGEYEDGYRSEDCPQCAADGPSEDCGTCHGYGKCYPFEEKEYGTD